jgi:hypothetical protein
VAYVWRDSAALNWLANHVDTSVERREETRQREAAEKAIREVAEYGDYVDHRAAKLAAQEKELSRQALADIRTSRLETDSEKRKAYPLYSGPLRYFPDALAEVAALCKAGNDKHNPGEPMHWARSKSTDELDCLARHLLEAGTLDTDGFYHDVKVAWRALSNLQKLLETQRGLPISPASRP